jgi:hypothetical protein
MSYNTHLPVLDYLIIGREDTLQYSQRQLVSAGRGLLSEPIDQRSEGQLGNRRQNQEFLAAIAEGRPAAIGAETVLPALRVLQELHDLWLSMTPPGALHPIGPA